MQFSKSKVEPEKLDAHPTGPGLWAGRYWRVDGLNYMYDGKKIVEIFNLAPETDVGLEPKGTFKIDGQEVQRGDRKILGIGDDAGKECGIYEVKRGEN